jgi:hypothetical protein
MPVPFTVFPTLGEFIAAAVEQKCRLCTLPDITGPRGSAPARYLVAPPEKGGAIQILPNIRNVDRLAPSQIAGLVRVLKITGFERYFIDDSKPTHYDYHPEKPS